MHWLGFSLLSLGLWGVWGFLGKVASQHLPSQQVYLLAISGHLVVAGYLWAGGGGAGLLATLGRRRRLGGRPGYGLGAPLFLRGPGPGPGYGGGAPHRSLPGRRRGLKPGFPPGSPDPAPPGRPRPGVGGRLAAVQIVCSASRVALNTVFLKNLKFPVK